MARPVYERLRQSTPKGYYLVADTAFPRGTKQIEGRIRVPMKAGDKLPVDPVDLYEKVAFSNELIAFRQTAEWGMRAIQGSFGRLRIPLDVNDDSGRANLMETCFRLHNLRTRRIGFNQIQTVYVPCWRGGQDRDDVWDGFETLTFAEQRLRDRVSRFHLTVQYD